MSSNPMQEWLEANDEAVEAAAKCITKKGAFNPPLEKTWPEWERLRKLADEKWYAYRKDLERRMLEDIPMIAKSNDDLDSKIALYKKLGIT